MWPANSAGMGGRLLPTHFDQIPVHATSGRLVASGDDGALERAVRLLSNGRHEQPADRHFALKTIEKKGVDGTNLEAHALDLAFGQEDLVNTRFLADHEAHADDVLRLAAIRRRGAGRDVVGHN